MPVFDKGGLTFHSSTVAMFTFFHLSLPPPPLLPPCSVWLCFHSLPPGAVALLVRLLVFISTWRVYRNFGEGLRERGWLSRDYNAMVTGSTEIQREIEYRPVLGSHSVCVQSWFQNLPLPALRVGSKLLNEVPSNYWKYKVTLLIVLAPTSVSLSLWPLTFLCHFQHLKQMRGVACWLEPQWLADDGDQTADWLAEADCWLEETEQRLLLSVTSLGRLAVVLHAHWIGNRTGIWWDLVIGWNYSDCVIGWNHIQFS